MISIKMLLDDHQERGSATSDVTQWVGAVLLVMTGAAIATLIGAVLWLLSPLLLLLVVGFALADELTI